MFRDKNREGVLCDLLKSEGDYYVSYEHGACGTLSAGISLVVFCRDHSEGSVSSPTNNHATPSAAAADRRNRANVWDKRFGGETCPSFADPVGGGGVSSS